TKIGPAWSGAAGSSSPAASSRAGSDRKLARVIVDLPCVRVARTVCSIRGIVAENGRRRGNVCVTSRQRGGSSPTGRRTAGEMRRKEGGKRTNDLAPPACPERPRQAVHPVDGTTAPTRSVSGKDRDSPTADRWVRCDRRAQQRLPCRRGWGSGQDPASSAVGILKKSSERGACLPCQVGI